MKYLLMLFAMIIIVGCSEDSNPVSFGDSDQSYVITEYDGIFPFPIQGERQVTFYVWTNDQKERGMFRTFQHPFTTFRNIDTLWFFFPSELEEDVNFVVMAGNEPSLYLLIAPTAIINSNRIFRKFFEGIIPAGKKTYFFPIDESSSYKYYYINMDRSSLFPAPAKGYITSHF